MILFNEENPIKIVIADDHEIVRVGMKKLLSFSKILNIIDEAADGVELIEKCKLHQPNVAIVDIFMPKMTGIEAIPKIRKESPDTFIIMLTAFEDLHHVELALSVGADGYLSKGVSSNIIQDAVLKVVNGERVFSKSIMKLIRDQRMTYDQTNEDNVSLTKRENEILKLVAEGKSNKQLAEELKVSIRTVETHRHNLIKKFGIKNASQLVRFAILNNINNNDEIICDTEIDIRKKNN
jgi:DNA-binding NarL/FixJ family response regulator